MFWCGEDVWGDGQLPDGSGSLERHTLRLLVYAAAVANRTEGRIMKLKLDTMALISVAIAVAIWVLVIWTAIAAIVAHI
jgi:hypothetical protein